MILAVTPLCAASSPWPASLVCFFQVARAVCFPHSVRGPWQDEPQPRGAVKLVPPLAPAEHRRSVAKPTSACHPQPPALQKDSNLQISKSNLWTKDTQTCRFPTPLHLRHRDCHPVFQPCSGFKLAQVSDHRLIFLNAVFPINSYMYRKYLDLDYI